MRSIGNPAIAIAIALFMGSAATSQARVPASLSDPANCERIEPARGHVVHRCDDGVPGAGGISPNAGGERAITVPAAYRGHRGLPRKAPGAVEVPGADSEGNVALDAAITLPTVPPRGRGYPLIVMMHGCCAGSKESSQRDSFDASGEAWHYSDAWFAARGYVVLTYTSRGFVDGQNRGSTGETQLQSRHFEINDLQHLACQVKATAHRFSRVSGRRVRVDPRRVVVTGGSYGGGFSWMAATDPRWRCTPDTGTAGTRMRIAAVAPKFGWTDIAYSLAPTGKHSGRPASLPATSGCDSGPRRRDGRPCPPGAGMPIGMPKTTIVTGLYASGKVGIPPGTAHATFSSRVDQAIICLELPFPFEHNPLCRGTLEQTLPEFLADRSAYYQEHFFKRLRRQPRFRVPVFSAAAFTDPLFTAVEHRRMTNRILRIRPGYPIRTFHGDFQHFVQNKAKEWNDVCVRGGERRVCRSGDFRRGFDRPSPYAVRTGITTHLNRFIDRFARPPGVRRPPRPRLGVTASLQVCPENSREAGPQFMRDRADEPGRRFTARTFERLARNTLRLGFAGRQTTLSKAVPNLHAVSSDPLANELTNDKRCPVERLPAGPGVATYTTEPLRAQRTMIGATRVDVGFAATGSETAVQLNARLYDVYPDGKAVMVDRGVRRLTEAEVAAGEVAFELHGNGWRFPAGHRVRIELAQDDFPYVQLSTPPSSLTISSATLRLPVREGPRG